MKERAQAKQTAAGSSIVVGIPVYDGVDMLDVVGPYEMFSWAGLTVRLVAESPAASCVAAV